MKSDLLKRDYKPHITDLAIRKAKSKSREATLQRKNKIKQNERRVFAVAYDPRLPAIQPTQAKHWRAMVSQDQHLAEVFPKPPLTGFKHQPNIRNLLIKGAQWASRGLNKDVSFWLT